MSPDRQARPEVEEARGAPQAAGAAPAVPVPAETPDPGTLTPAEQMALFEKDLKENDWGHQPC
jgi:hypothetical protein